MATRATVLVVAAHPDDEVLSCGATVARHADAGDRVHILILGTGAASRGPAGHAADFAAETAVLRDAAGKAAAILGAEAPRFADVPDNRADSLDLLDIVKIVEAAVTDIAPEIVYTHHAHDLNIDHRRAHEAVLTACRPLPGTAVSALYTFETMSSTEWAAGGAASSFSPTRFVDVEASFARKIQALKCYADEMRQFPHARSIEAIEALARYRGASAGMTFAEAFMVVRELVR